MSNEDILVLLKSDLSISVDNTTKQGEAIETLLTNYISLSQEAISREGITLEDTTEDGMLVMMYARYLYHKRAEVLVAMPRQLRYMLNNRLLSQKARQE